MPPRSKRGSDFNWLTGQQRWCCSLDRCFGCAGRDTAIYEKCLAGYITAGFGGEKHDCSVKIVRPSWPLHGYAIREVLHPCRILVHDLILPGAKPAGSEAVDRNPMLPQSSARLIVSCLIPPRLAP